MSDASRVRIHTLSTGVPGLDRVLGGGLPEFSFSLIAGGPGAGKTTLAHQIVFANAAPERRAVYFTVLGEPAIKMLRYQQQYGFFDPAKVDGNVEFVNLSQEVLNADLSKVLDRIVRVVEQTSPALVAVDSFRTVVRAAEASPSGELELQAFVQRLALYLTSWQATTFLVGEYSETETRDNPIFTVADGIIWLTQNVERNSVVRKLQVLKERGQAPMPGLHTFRITDDGIQVFPRILQRPGRAERPPARARASWGVPGLDEMLGGGVPAGDAVLLAGPSGSGKTVFSTQFIAAGAAQGEPGVIATFEERPADYMARAKLLGFDLEEMVRQNQLRVFYLRPLDLSVDETLEEIHQAVSQVRAKRVLIDSLSGFELALAPTFREDFRESLYRMVGALTGGGVTVLMTVELTESFTNLSFSPHTISFLADDIVIQRYVEIAGQLRRLVTVAKMRNSAHSKDLREYEITARGVVVGATLSDYRGLITGVPQLRETSRRTIYPGLSDPEIAVLEALVRLKEAASPALARATTVRGAALSAALARLVALNYVIRVEEAGQTVYRPVARVLGE
jgi:circadian clock protein KaiC